MMVGFPRRAHFPLRKWRSSRDKPAGKISATANSVLRDRRFGWRTQHDMKVLATVAEALAQSRARLPRVLVPTMGALHKAHLELIRVARDSAGRDGEVAVSIFVNPLQFEPGSDYERYPRPDRQDEELCRNAEVDLLFRPSPAEMYADDRSVFVEETSLSNTLEGKSRPGHFRGVCTAVAKLFNILAPNAAVFGEKDFQQLAIIRRMVRDLNFKID